MCWCFVYALLFVICHSLNAIMLDTDCNNYTVDKCKLDDHAILETIKDISIYDCQNYCHNIYTRNCTFFIFDNQQIVCQLVKEEIHQYVNSCRTIAGPVNPSIQECKELKDDCKVPVALF